MTASRIFLLVLLGAWGCTPSEPASRPTVAVTPAAVPTSTAAAAPLPSFSGCFEQRRTLPELSMSEGFFADVNGDGRSDVVALGHRVDGSGDDSMFVLAGGGDGGFSLLRQERVPAGWLGLAAGDFDGDGAVDFAASDYERGELSVRLGRGKRFEAVAKLSVGRKAGMAAAADLDGDGNLDLALAHAREVRLLMGDGLGGFQPGRRLKTGAYPSRPVLVDFDGDGHRDLLVASNDSHFLSVFLQRDGRLTEDARYPCGAGGAPLAVADFDGDGTLDVAMGAVNSRTTCLFRGRGGGRLVLDQELDDGGFGVAANDLDGDGRAELLVAKTDRRHGFGRDWGVLSIYTLQDGKLARLIRQETAAPAEALWVHDVNADGMKDILLISQHGVTSMLGRICPPR